VVFVSDDSDFVNRKDPARLNELIQTEAEKSAQWLKDNKLCVAGEKSKLLVLGTCKMRAANHFGQETKISVDWKAIVLSSSEQLLGLVLNNKLTCQNHMYGYKNKLGATAKQEIGNAEKVIQVYEQREAHILLQWNLLFQTEILLASVW
jgi:hypothetical protein